MKYIIVEDAQDAISLLSEIGCATRIVIYVVILRMGGAIDLDDEGGFAAKKIDSERANRMLANELVVLQPPTAQG